MGESKSSTAVLNLRIEGFDARPLPLEFMTEGEEIVELQHSENSRILVIHANFSCSWAACDLTLFTQTVILNLTTIPFEFYCVRENWAQIIPYNQENHNLVMASEIAEVIIAQS